VHPPTLNPRPAQAHPAILAARPRVQHSRGLPPRWTTPRPPARAGPRSRGDRTRRARKQHTPAIAQCAAADGPHFRGESGRLCAPLRAPQDTLFRWLEHVEGAYRPNPYHNGAPPPPHRRHPNLLHPILSVRRSCPSEAETIRPNFSQAQCVLGRTRSPAPRGAGADSDSRSSPSPRDPRRNPGPGRAPPGVLPASSASPPQSNSQRPRCCRPPPTPILAAPPTPHSAQPAAKIGGSAPRGRRAADGALHAAGGGRRPILQVRGRGRGVPGEELEGVVMVGF
jgi:hypothetical protein